MARPPMKQEAGPIGGNGLNIASSAPESKSPSKYWIPCVNRCCDRVVSDYGMYCCLACRLAYDGKYKIHETGILGHSDKCNQRQGERCLDDAKQGQ